jgi:hypothetical protein
MRQPPDNATLDYVGYSAVLPQHCSKSQATFQILSQRQNRISDILARASRNTLYWCLERFSPLVYLSSLLALYYVQKPYSLFYLFLSGDYIEYGKRQEETDD